MEYKYIIGSIAIGIAIILFFGGSNEDSCTNFPVTNGTLAVTVDKNNYFTITRNSIEKWSSSGRRLAHSRLFSGAKCLRYISNDIVIANGNTFMWINPDTLTIEDSTSVPELKDQSISWFDYAGDQWWVGVKNAIFTFDLSWKLIGFWKLPCVPFGAAFINNYLLVTKYTDNGNLSTLYDLPDQSVNVKKLANINCTVGDSPPCIKITPRGLKIVSIDKSTSTLQICKLNL